MVSIQPNFGPNGTGNNGRGKQIDKPAEPPKTIITELKIIKVDDKGHQEVIYDDGDKKGGTVIISDGGITQNK